MRIGFGDIDEKEQKYNKRLYHFNMFLSKLLVALMVILFAGSLLAGLYFAVNAWKFGGDIEDVYLCVRFAVAMGEVLLGILVIFKLIFWLIGYLQKKIVLVSPELENSGRQKEYSLKCVLSSMRIQGLIIAWDIVIVLFLAMFLFLRGDGVPMTDTMRIRNTIICAGILVGGHLLLKLYYRTRPNEKRMLKNTKEFFAVDNETLFCEKLDNSIRNNLLFCSKSFCFTKEFFMGQAQTMAYNNIVAVPVEQIREMEHYILSVNTGRGITYTGVLACKLENEKVVNFYLGTGKTQELTLNALDFYHINYRNNEETVYASSFHRT